MNNCMSFLMMILALGCGVAMAAEYKVGAEAGWILEDGDPPIRFRQWTSDKTFFIGDILIFNYQTAKDDVLEVTGEHFKKCNKEVPIGIYRTGSDRILLKRAGYHYFITSVTEHCKSGQKLAVKVDYAPGQPYTPSEEELHIDAPSALSFLPPYYNAPTEGKISYEKLEPELPPTP